MPGSKSMKAIALRAHGGPEVLELMDLAIPTPGRDELLIRVLAIGVNPADWKWRQGMFADHMPVSFPYIPGYDIAGIVESGPGYAAGTPVLAMLDNLKGGAYAQYAVAQAQGVAVIPDGMDYVTAAAIPCPGLTGLQVIEDNVRPARGETVIITGATGSVGRFALIAAKRRGAKVVAAVRAAHRQAALDLGADEALPLDQAEDAISADHLVDTVGGPLIAPWARKIRQGGRIRTVATDPIPAEGLLTTPQFSRVRPDTMQLTRIAQEVAAGCCPLPPLRTMPLEEASSAHAMLEYGRGGGKIVLVVR